MPTTVQPARANFSVFEETVPVAVPTSSETLTAVDCWLEELTLSGTATSGNVTITDGSDVPILNAITIDNGTIYQKILGARYMPGGIKWSSSAAGPVGFLRWKR